MDINSKYTQNLKTDIANGYLGLGGEPLKCHCGCTEFKDVVKDFINSDVAEYQRHCKKCDKILGYWSYGYWQL